MIFKKISTILATGNLLEFIKVLFDFAAYFNHFKHEIETSQKICYTHFCIMCLQTHAGFGVSTIEPLSSLACRKRRLMEASMGLPAEAIQSVVKV